MWLPEVPGIITAEQVAETGAALASLQLPTGMIPWFEGGHADPWNHVEAAMALDLSGHRAEAEAAYQWLVDMQRPDGAWHQYYLADRVEQDKLDANCVAYIATGTLHHFQLTDDRSFLETMWPVVDRAISFVLDLQEPRGEIRWARHTDGTPWSFALLTGSSSICHSLRAAIVIAAELGHERPSWELSVARLAHVIRTDPNAFAPKERWAMDWYYPVLSGAVTGQAGIDRLADGFDTFVMDQRGVRCVSDRPWVTAAETCECALAYLSVGDEPMARQLFTWAQSARTSGGRYYTGTVYPQEVQFPADETSSYTAAAIILAADALGQTSPASGLLWDHSTFPALLPLDNSDVGADQPSLD